MKNFFKKLFSDKKKLSIAIIGVVLVVALVVTLCVCLGKHNNERATAKVNADESLISIQDDDSIQLNGEDSQNGESAAGESSPGDSSPDANPTADDPAENKTVESLKPITISEDNKKAENVEEAEENKVVEKIPVKEVSDLGNNIVTDEDDSQYVVIDSQTDNDDIVINEPQTISTSNTDCLPRGSVAEGSYFQYQFLNSNQRAAYNTICDAVRQTQTVVDLRDCKLSSQETVETFKAIMGDHPEFFWLYRDMSMTFNPITQKISMIALLYTDGTTVDKINRQYQLVRVADRGVISNQIANFSVLINEAVGQIPSGLTQLEMEKFIHDFIVKNITYNYAAAKDPLSNLRSFDAYGAIRDRCCVCEGYSKLFQYLCYQVGINSTQIFGEAKTGGAHMWNAAQVDGDWYFVDCTWDDCLKDHIVYKNFNITGNEIATDHSFYNTLRIPNCTATKNSFKNTCVFHVTTLAESPETDNVAAVCRIMKHTGSKDIIFYFDGVEPTRDYLYDYIYRVGSSFKASVTSAKYSIRLTDEYGTVSDFVYWEGLIY